MIDRLDVIAFRIGAQAVSVEISVGYLGRLRRATRLCKHGSGKSSKQQECAHKKRVFCGASCTTKKEFRHGDSLSVKQTIDNRHKNVFANQPCWAKRTTMLGMKKYQRSSILATDSLCTQSLVLCQIDS